MLAKICSVRKEDCVGSRHRVDRYPACYHPLRTVPGHDAGLNRAHLDRLLGWYSTLDIEFPASHHNYRLYLQQIEPLPTTIGCWGADHRQHHVRQERTGLINSVTHYYCSSIGRDAATQSSSTTTYGEFASVLLRHELSDKEMCVVCTINRMRLKQTR